MIAWEPVSYEDMLIYEYWKKNMGELFLEVPIGNREYEIWPPSGVRRIDGVMVYSDNRTGVYSSHNYTLKDFDRLVQGKKVELIEVKEKLDRYVIGQVIAGTDMFEAQYKANKIIPIIVCNIGDPALDWVCKRRGIDVNIVNGVSR